MRCLVVYSDIEVKWPVHLRRRAYVYFESFVIHRFGNESFLLGSLQLSLWFPFPSTGIPKLYLIWCLQYFRISLSAHKGRRTAYPRFRFLVLFWNKAALLFHTSCFIELLCLHLQFPLILTCKCIPISCILVWFGWWENRQRNFL